MTGGLNTQRRLVFDDRRVHIDFVSTGQPDFWAGGSEIPANRQLRPCMAVQTVSPAALGRRLSSNLWNCVALILVIAARALIVTANRLRRRFRARCRSGVARYGQSSGLCVANDYANAAGHRLLDHFHVRLRRPCRQEALRRDGADPAARHPAAGTNPRLSHLHGRLFHELVPGRVFGAELLACVCRTAVELGTSRSQVTLLSR